MQVLCKFNTGTVVGLVYSCIVSTYDPSTSAFSFHADGRMIHQSDRTWAHKGTCPCTLCSQVGIGYDKSKREREDTRTDTTRGVPTETTISTHRSIVCLDRPYREFKFSAADHEQDWQLNMPRCAQCAKSDVKVTTINRTWNIPADMFDLLAKRVAPLCARQHEKCVELNGEGDTKPRQWVHTKRKTKVAKSFMATQLIDSKSPLKQKRGNEGPCYENWFVVSCYRYLIGHISTKFVLWFLALESLRTLYAPNQIQSCALPRTVI